MSCNCRSVGECDHDLFRSEMTDEEFHPRAMKLIRKRKNFLVVAEDEPYFDEVYRMIRQDEMWHGRWTAEDEVLFKAALARPKEG